MSQYTTVSDGVVVTDNGIPPPVHWTNNYEDMGGDVAWGPGGLMENELDAREVFGKVRPHYAKAAYTGEPLVLFEVGSGEFYIFNTIDTTMLRIRELRNLQSIVDILNDEDKGLDAFFEEL